MKRGEGETPGGSKLDAGGGCQKTALNPANRQRRPKVFWLPVAILLLVTASAFLHRLPADNMSLGWPNNVLQNWADYGFFKLHGRMAINPGGFEILEKPVTYSGHRAVSLYPAYLAKTATAWIGAGMLPFLAGLSLVALLSIWWLLGRTPFALLFAGAAILSPGYVRWTVVLDPNVMAALFGLPFAAVVLAQLQRAHLPGTAIAGLAVMTVAYTAINWSTSLVHGILFCALLATRHIKRQRVMLYLVLAGSCILLVGSLSVVDKLASAKTLADSPGTSGGLLSLLPGYTWGRVGYGADLTAYRALVRLAFANTLGLLPLFVLGAFALVRTAPRANLGRLGWAACPFLGSVCEIGVLRNYFAHHPWMAASFLLVGLVLSLWVWLAPCVGAAPLQPALPAVHPRWHLGCWAVAFAYGWAVLFFSRTYQEGYMPLAHSVRLSTERPAAIVVARDRDPALAVEAPRLAEILDRRVVIIDSLGEAAKPSRPAYLLTAQPLAGQTAIARTREQRKAAPAWVDQALAWFGRTIARRQAGKRIELFNDYLLFKLQPKGTP
jgi:hypothetical protein